MAYANAQQISVVSPGGETTLYTDLNLAIQGAQAGSTVYLSGGGFQISDATKITKKLTIMGVGHRVDNGNTNVGGNFWFEEGSDGSSVMGIYLGGNINIGTSTNAVNNFLLRFCNVGEVYVRNSNCQGVLINQNYIRGGFLGANSAVSITNNVIHLISNINAGIIDNNIITFAPGSGSYPLGLVSNSQIRNNIIFQHRDNIHTGSACLVSNNLLTRGWGDNCCVVTSLNDVFVGPNNGVNPNSNFQLKEGLWKTGATDGGEIGIYGGTGFKDTALPPGPRIVASKIADQTDASGNLSVEITVSVEQ